MTFGDLFALIDKYEFSAEQFAAYMDVSGMTLRRWQSQDKNGQIPELYQPAISKAVEKLILQKVISIDSPEARPFLKGRDLNNLSLNFLTLGLSLEELNKIHDEDRSTDSIYKALETIGADEARQTIVTENVATIEKTLVGNVDMLKSAKTLLNVIFKNTHANQSKLLAFGALFYLLAPLDLIPDTIPVFGYIDDFAILSLAASYYTSSMTKKSKK